MVVTVQVPNEYGWVVLGAGVGSVICNIVLGGPVMKGRKALDVPLPNMYATPGVHKHANEFNRIQRSHQNYMECLDSYIAMTLLGGLQYPIPCAVGTVFYYLGSILYQKGYIDPSLDVGTARYKKGGALKWIGFFTSFYSTCAFAYHLINNSVTA
mmetsp:Transcript_51006/g.57772  ORF Transcript_51006/g.57772 Transcript_51006/m.57772 type:complete len:155 (+) Transcript_51006:69-533(+)